MTKKRKKKSTPFKISSHCPQCNRKVIKIEKDAAHRCLNDLCPGKIKGQIEHYVSKNCMDIDGFGTKLVDQLVDTNKILILND